MKIFKIIIVIILYLVLLFFLIPFPLLVLKIITLDDAKNYYPIISAILGSIVGLTSIVAGAYYYFDKERRNKISLLKQEIEKYDESTLDILELVVKNDEELERKRNTIIRASERIELMLDDETGFLPFSRNAAKKILALNSFVDKNELLMRSNFELISKASMISVKDLYLDIAKTAKIICYLNSR